MKEYLFVLLITALTIASLWVINHKLTGPYTREEIVFNKIVQEQHMGASWLAAATRYAGVGDTLRARWALRQAMDCVRNADSLREVYKTYAP